MFPSCHITRLFREDEDLSGSTKDKVSSERGLGSEHDKWAWILNRQNIVEGSQKEYIWVEMQIIKDHSDHTTNLDLIPSNFDNDTSDKDEVESNNSTSAAIPVPEKSSSATPSIKSSYSVAESSLNSRNDNIDNGFKQQNENEVFSVEPFFSPIMTSLHQSVDIKDSGRVARQHQTNSFNDSSPSNTGLCSIITTRHSTNRLSSPLQKPKLSCISKASSGYVSYSGGTLSSSKSCPSLISLGAQSSAEGKQQSIPKIPGFRSQDPYSVQNVTSYSDLEVLRESANDALQCMSDPQKLQQKGWANENSRPTCRHACCEGCNGSQDAGFEWSSVETCDASTSPHMPIEEIWRNEGSEQCVINPVIAEKLDVQDMRIGHSYEYDVFLDYNIQDEKWALNLLKILEGYNFCIYLHARDGVLGKHSIPEIANQLQNSFKYICLLSPNFLNSSEVMENLHMAQYERTSNRPFSNYVILLKITPCEVPLSLKSLEWEDCTRKACKDGPDRYVVDKVVKAIRDVT